ncbi:alpha-amylase [Alkalicoccus daliensis]|nr:alpha-amylase [Alkalicoccus daliensis]
MMQFFEWHLPNDGEHWKRLAERAEELKSKGFDSIWIPPAAKAISQDDNGYATYDVYDLGEFDQKDTVRTKYGTKEELLEAVEACHEHGLQVYADVVMNHKAGADETETFEVIKVDPDNREEEISEPFEIEGWTYFNFPGRDGKHSDFVWHHHHFNGTDYDAANDEEGIFRILGDHKEFTDHVVDEFGNYDFLMFANIDYQHPEVKEEMIHWASWFAEETGVDGFRLDAIKHINHLFIADFIGAVKEAHGDDFYIVGEFWQPELEIIETFLEYVDYGMNLFDVTLHYKFFEASNQGPDFDLTTIFEDTLVGTHPLQAVTFVDNHDSQPNESLESWVDDWFKPLAYALILLREDGYPCVFYGDYYGIDGEAPQDGKQEMLDPLLHARSHFSYGPQEDYFDHPNTIGWVRFGEEEKPNSGCAVIMSNGEPGAKVMHVGEHRAGETWHDMTGTMDNKITIGDDGNAEFPVEGGSVSVYVQETE